MKKYTGKTLNDVLNTAEKEKGVSVEDLTYFVTEEKQGFLGIGASVTAEVYASCDVKEFLFNYIGEFFTGLNQDVEIEIIEENEGYRIMLNAENNAVFRTGGLVINDDTKEVTVDDEPVKLTPIEYNILLLLVKNQGRVFSINQIYESIWEEEAIGADNTVAVHIRHIREKIEINPKEPRYLKVVWGVGYKIEKQ